MCTDCVFTISSLFQKKNLFLFQRAYQTDKIRKLWYEREKRISKYSIETR